MGDHEQRVTSGIWSGVGTERIMDDRIRVVATVAEVVKREFREHKVPNCKGHPGRRLPSSKIRSLLQRT